MIGTYLKWIKGLASKQNNYDVETGLLKDRFAKKKLL